MRTRYQRWESIFDALLVHVNSDYDISETKREYDAPQAPKTGLSYRSKGALSDDNIHCYIS